MNNISVIRKFNAWRDKKPYRDTIVIALLVLLVYLPIFTTRIVRSIDQGYLTGSSKHYFLYAYHLKKHHLFSHEFVDSPDVKVNAYRSPGYPAFLYLCMSLWPDFKDITLDDLTTIPEDGKYKGERVLDEEKNSGFFFIKFCEGVMLFLISLSAGWLTWRITGLKYAALIIMVLAGCNHHLEESVNSLHSELLHTFLLMLFSICMLVIVEKKKLLVFGLAGLVLGCLALTRATWYYYFIPGLLIFLLFLWKSPLEKKKILIGVALFSICFGIIVGGWMLRNYCHFKRAFITERGGLVLAYRMNYNMMSFKEYTVSFIYWTKRKYAFRQVLLDRFFKPEDYANLDRHNPNGYYNSARNRRLELNQIHDPQTADKILMDETVKKFIKHPFRHLLITIPFTYRGIQYFASFFINVIIFFLAVTAFVRAVIKLDLKVLAVFTPAAVMFMFNCFLTHNIPRFNLPFIVIFYVGAFAGIQILWDRYKKSPDQVT